jgi:aldehyde dehydrogenase (NAD+)
LSVHNALAIHPFIDNVAFTGITVIDLHENLINITLSVLLSNSAKRVQKFSWTTPTLTVLSNNPLQLFTSIWDNTVVLEADVHEKIYDEFVQKKSKEAAAKRKVGNQLETDTDQGPLVNRDQHNKYLHYIKVGQAAKLVTGGKQKSRKVFFVGPNVFKALRMR